jgi:hypothetical protein
MYEQARGPVWGSVSTQHTNIRESRPKFGNMDLSFISDVVDVSVLGCLGRFVVDVLCNSILLLCMARSVLHKFRTVCFALVCTPEYLVKH